MSFLADRELRPLNLPEPYDLKSVDLALGNGPNALEVAVTESTSTPTLSTLRAVWKARLGGRATPLLLVVLYDGKAALCGPAGRPTRHFLGSVLERIQGFASWAERHLCSSQGQRPTV
jgi:hypothetical protein